MTNPLLPPAFLVLALLLWRYTLHIGIAVVTVPLLLVGWALTRLGAVQVGGLVVLAGADFALWLNDWVRNERLR